jgi:Na+-transporting NADH:ubiquinone oxidoreductase subunit NqrB
MPDTRDPRLYQIACLSGLLAYGLGGLGFDIGLAQVATSLGVALLAQYACGRLAGVPRFDPRSALISGLSMCLLLRTDSLALAAAGTFLAVASKFVIRVRGKHVFNPTNFGLVAMILGTDRVWASSGQWGTGAFFAVLMACLGGVVAHRAWRSDVAWAFLAAYVALLFGRAYGLGDPLVIPLHSLESGALLLFTFFMISDPRTTPDAREARIAFGVLVAAGAYYVQFRLFRTNGLLWSLFVLSPLVPLLDRLLPGDRYHWPSFTSTTRPRGVASWSSGGDCGGGNEPASSSPPTPPAPPSEGDVDATLVADPGRLAAGPFLR